MARLIVSTQGTPAPRSSHEVSEGPHPEMSFCDLAGDIRARGAAGDDNVRLSRRVRLRAAFTLHQSLMRDRTLGMLQLELMFAPTSGESEL